MDVLKFPIGIKIKEKHTLKDLGKIIAYSGDYSWIKFLQNGKEYKICREYYHHYEFFIPEDVTGMKVKFGNKIFEITDWNPENSFIPVKRTDRTLNWCFDIHRIVIGELSFIKDNNHLIGKPVMALKDYPYLTGNVKKGDIGIIKKIDGEYAIADFESQKEYQFPIDGVYFKYLEPLKEEHLAVGTTYVRINYELTPRTICKIENRRVYYDHDNDKKCNYFSEIIENSNSTFYLVSLSKSVLNKPHPIDISYTDVYENYKDNCCATVISGDKPLCGKGLTSKSEIKKDRLRLNVKNVEPLKVQETKFKILKIKTYDIYTKSN